MTKPYTPQTNGMVERFNGRVVSGVLGINVAGHDELETLLTSFNLAYNQRRQRVINGLSPAQMVDQQLRTHPCLANSRYRPAQPKDIMGKADDNLYYANDVSLAIRS